MTISGGLTALVLAGRRPGAPDEMAEAERVSHKALIDVGGQPMIARVLEALRGVSRVKRVLLAAGDDLRGPLAAIDASTQFAPASGTPATTVRAALAELSRGEELLVTTCDHPLLSSAMIETFLKSFDSARLGAAAACVTRATYEARYAGTRRTFVNLRDFSFSGANLFWFRAGAAEPLLDFWRALEAQRKHPARMAASIGLAALVLYATGMLTKARLIETIEKKSGVKADLVALPQAEAAIDVDKPVDLELVRRILSRNSAS